MAQYQSAGTSAGANSVTCTITAPTGIQVGDYLIAAVNCTGSATISPPSGFTTIQRTVNAGVVLETFGKIADSGDAAASNFAFGLSTTTGNIGGMIRCSNFLTSGPTGTPTVATGTNNTVNPSAISSNYDDDLLILVGGSDAAVTWTTSIVNGTATERVDVSTSLGNAASVTIATAVISPTGSSGTITITRNDTVDEMIGHAFLLKTEAINVTATPAVLVGTLSIPAPTATSGNSAVPATLTGTFTINAPTPTLPAPWTLPSKSTTTWEIPYKS